MYSNGINANNWNSNCVFNSNLSIVWSIHENGHRLIGIDIVTSLSNMNTDSIAVIIDKHLYVG